MGAAAVVDQDTRLGDAYRDLRALQVVSEVEGWCRYVGVGPGAGQQVLDIGAISSHYRTLHRDEVWWWALGLADGHGAGELVLALADETVPDLISLDDAAARLGLTLDGVDYHIAGGSLYPVTGLQRRRHLFAAQVEAMAATRAAAPDAALVGATWLMVRALLPPAHRASHENSDTTPKASPDPLPVPAARAAAAHRRRRQALLIGHGRGWYTYCHPLTGGGHLVEVNSRPRELPSAGALPWLLGEADSRDLGALVAYRAGLG